MKTLFQLSYHKDGHKHYLTSYFDFSICIAYVFSVPIKDSLDSMQCQERLNSILSFLHFDVEVDEGLFLLSKTIPALSELDVLLALHYDRRLLLVSDFLQLLKDTWLFQDAGAMNVVDE